METELRVALLVIGVCFIIGIVVHGIWKIRRGEEQKNRLATRVEPTSSIDDDCDIGPVRIVTMPQAQPQVDDILNSSEEVSLSSDSFEHESESLLDSDTEKRIDTPDKHHSEHKLYGAVVSNPKPHMHTKTTDSREVSIDESAIPPPPGFLLKQTSASPETPAQVVVSPQVTDPVVVKKNQQRSTARRTRLHDDQLRIDFDDNETSSSMSSNIEEGVSETTQEQEVLVINVRANDELPINGAALLPLLLTLGFKFGDQDIFHRHVNANGKGPVLFSLANMFKPGVFDIDNLETFQTKGVSLFMILPIEGDAHQVFNMMHNAARKLAEEFNAQILDGRRSVLTKQGLQQYAEKIREFERKRIVARHASQ